MHPMCSDWPSEAHFAACHWDPGSEIKTEGPLHYILQHLLQPGPGDMESLQRVQLQVQDGASFPASRAAPPSTWCASYDYVESLLCIPCFSALALPRQHGQLHSEAKQLFSTFCSSLHQDSALPLWAEARPAPWATWMWYQQWVLHTVKSPIPHTKIWLIEFLYFFALPTRLLVTSGTKEQDSWQQFYCLLILLVSGEKLEPQPRPFTPDWWCQRLEAKGVQTCSSSRQQS